MFRKARAARHIERDRTRGGVPREELDRAVAAGGAPRPDRTTVLVLKSTVERRVTKASEIKGEANVAAHNIPLTLTLANRARASRGLAAT